MKELTITITLNDWETNALAVMMKDEFRKNLDFLKQNEKACVFAPELKSFTDFTMKEQKLYNKVYMAIRAAQRQEQEV